MNEITFRPLLRRLCLIIFFFFFVNLSLFFLYLIFCVFQHFFSFYLWTIYEVIDEQSFLCTAILMKSNQHEFKLANRRKKPKKPKKKHINRKKKLIFRIWLSFVYYAFALFVLFSFLFVCIFSLPDSSLIFLCFAYSLSFVL